MKKLLVLGVLTSTFCFAQGTPPAVSLGGSAGVTGAASLLGQNILTHMADSNYLMVPSEWWAGTQIVPSTLTLTTLRVITAPSNPGQFYNFCNYSTGGFSVDVGASGQVSPIQVPNGVCVPMTYNSSAGIYVVGTIPGYVSSSSELHDNGDIATFYGSSGTEITSASSADIGNLLQNASNCTTAATAYSPESNSCLSVAQQQCYGLSCPNFNQLNAPFTSYSALSLTGPIDSTQTSITVTTTITGWPSSGCLAFATGEIACYASYTGSTFSGLVRGVQGTTAAAQTQPNVLGIVTSTAACSTCLVSQVITNTGSYSIGPPNPGLNPYLWVQGIPYTTSIFAGGDIISYGGIFGLTAAGTETGQDATMGSNHDSPPLETIGSFYTGAVSNQDRWSWTDVLGSGSNPTSTYTLSHSGTTGTPSVSVPFAVKLGAGSEVDNSSICTVATGCPSISGSIFTADGCSESSNIGGSTAGSLTLGEGGCNVTVTMGGGQTATHGWACSTQNTANPNTVTQTIGGTTTTAVFDANSSAETGDVVLFSCTAF